MDTQIESPAILANRQDTFVERASRVPAMMDEWESSVMARLDLLRDMDPIEKNFSVMNFHRNQLAILGTYSTKATIRMIGAVGATRSFDVGGESGMNVSFKPEVEFFPEKIVADTISKLSNEKSEKYEGEFEDFIVVYLNQIGSRLNPPVNLAEMVVKLSLENLDNRISDGTRIDLRKVITQLELPLDKQSDGYGLNAREKDLFDQLTPLTTDTAETFDPGLKPTRMPYSIGSAMKYVMNKSWYYFLNDVELPQINIEPDEPERPEIHAPNALEASISQIYEESGLKVGSPDRREIPQENLEWYLNSIKGDLSFGPGNVVMFYSQEKFKNRELVKLYNYPGLENFL